MTTNHLGMIEPPPDGERSPTPPSPAGVTGSSGGTYAEQAKTWAEFLASPAAGSFPDEVRRVTDAGIAAAVEAEARGEDADAAYMEAARKAGAEIGATLSMEARAEMAGQLADAMWGRAEVVEEAPAGAHDDECEGPDRCGCRRRRVFAAFARPAGDSIALLALLEGEDVAGSELLFDDPQDAALALGLSDMARIAYSAGRTKGHADYTDNPGVGAMVRELYGGVGGLAMLTARANLEQILATGEMGAGIPPTPDDIDVMVNVWRAGADIVSVPKAFIAGMEAERLRLTERLAYVDSATGRAVLERCAISQHVARGVLGAAGWLEFASHAEPGSFVEMLVALVAKCDVFNRRLLRRSFPEWVDAFDLYERDQAGVEELVRIAKGGAPAEPTDG